MKNILLTGANGQIGRCLRALPQPEGWQILALAHGDMDITDHVAVMEAFTAYKPDLIINAAAMTNVDQCEKDPDQAHAVNFIGAGNLATACASLDIPLIHISTDYVFDGKKDGAYLETDEVHPINSYGFTKMLGEDAVRNELPWHVILRISWVFSEMGDNMLTRLLKLMQTNADIKMVTDQCTRPTPGMAAAQTLQHIGQALLAGKNNGFGTYHFCGEPTVSRFDMAKIVAAEYEKRGHKAPKLIAARSSDFPTAAPRPANSAMDCSKIQRVYDIPACPWETHLADAMDRILATTNRQVA